MSESMGRHANAQHYETHDHLSDHEVWEKLRESGRRRISYREFAGRSSTRIDPKILQCTDSSTLSGPNILTIMDKNRSFAQPHRPNLKTENDHPAERRRAIHFNELPKVTSELSCWINKGKNVHVRDQFGNTHLHRAVIKGVTPVVIEFLANRGIDVNARNKARETALFIAASNGNNDLVKVLLKSGARRNLMNSKGVSPLKAASENGHVSVANELLASGSKAGQRERPKKRGSGRRPQYREKR